MCHRSRLVCVSCSLYRGCWDLRLSWLQESIVRPLFHKRKCGTVEFLKFKNGLHSSSWPRRLCYFTFPHLKTSQLAATMETPPQPSCLLSVPPVLFACLSFSQQTTSTTFRYFSSVLLYHFSPFLSLRLLFLSPCDFVYFSICEACWTPALCPSHSSH